MSKILLTVLLAPYIFLGGCVTNGLNLYKDPYSNENIVKRIEMDRKASVTPPHSYDASQWSAMANVSEKEAQQLAAAQSKIAQSFQACLAEKVEVYDRAEGEVRKKYLLADSRYASCLEKKGFKVRKDKNGFTEYVQAPL